MPKWTIRIVFIIIGITLFCFPIIRDRYESYQQQKVLSAWEQNLQQLDTAVSETEESITPVPNVLPASENTNADSLDMQSPEATPLASTSIEGVPVEGLLLIDKINLKLPILSDATPAHLKLSVASIAHTGKPGEIGNYAIAGHRNRTYGKNFNRLDEVKIGDVIQVKTADDTTYTYVVESKQYVLPTAVEVLEGNGKDSQITLITCHPMKNPTKRIVIKARLVKSEPHIS